MPLLRSRLIPSPSPPPSKPLSPPSSALLQPPTPAKTAHPPSPSPSPSHPPPLPPPPRRRSLRLSPLASASNGNFTQPTSSTLRVSDDVNVNDFNQLGIRISSRSTSSNREIEGNRVATVLPVAVGVSDVELNRIDDVDVNDDVKPLIGGVKEETVASVVENSDCIADLNGIVHTDEIKVEGTTLNYSGSKRKAGDSSISEERIADVDGDTNYISYLNGIVHTEEIKAEGTLNLSGSKRKARDSSINEEEGNTRLGVAVGNGVEENDVSSSVRVKKEGVTSPKKFTREEKGKGVLSSDDQHVAGTRMEEDELVGSPRRYTREEKGKGIDSILIDENGVVHDHDDDDYDYDVDLEYGLYLSREALNAEMEPGQGVNVGDGINVGVNGEQTDYVPSRSRLAYMKDQHKNIAKLIAHKYAHFSMDDDEGIPSDQANREGAGGGEDFGDGSENGDTGTNVEDWPGPFSTAMKIIRDREKNLGKQAQKSNLEKGGMPLISWTPRNERDADLKRPYVPSLQSMCMKGLAENVDAIGSLNYVPDVLRHRLCQMLCDSRRMNAHFFSLLLQGSPSEVRVADCSWLEEEDFESSIKACDTSNLTVLQLDLSGHCISDASLLKAVASKGLPVLTTISLKGACRISDAGLKVIVSAAPVLRSLNLSQCSLLTDVGINTLADVLGSILHELYLDDCDTLNAMSILPSLKRLVHLEVLSLRGISSVSDKFIKELITSNGKNMKELILANCVNLRDSSLKVIAETCSQLCVLDLSYLRKLTDIGMAYLGNGCHGIQDLRLCRNAFSDDAIAAFLETCGESLKELSLNNVTKVGQHTVISLACRCKNLESLDLSWCRSLRDEALGLIADSCVSLKLLKIFGCTQVTEIFVDGHSNPHLHIVGMKLTPILENIKRPDFQQGPLYYSAVPSS